jgi:AraC family transcriptional regulator, transcriptional activator of pobA
MTTRKRMSSNPTYTDKNDDAIVLEKYRQVYRKYLDDKIIDMDKRMKHPFDFQIYPLETAIPYVNYMVPPSRQTPYWIVLVKKGSGEKSIGAFTFPVKEQTLYIVPKRMLHSSKDWSVDTSGYVLLFNIDFFLNNAFPKHLISNKKVLKNSIRPYLYLDALQTKSLSDMFETILDEHSSDEREKKEMIAIKILEILINCDRLFSQAEQIGNERYYHPVVERFNSLLEANFTKERLVSLYAAALDIHPNNLNFLIREHTGISAKQTINNRIITEAKYLLTHSDQNIKVIANQLGFEEAHNFSTFFKKNVGISPVAYKASLIVSVK